MVIVCVCVYSCVCMSYTCLHAGESKTREKKEGDLLLLRPNLFPHPIFILLCLFSMLEAFETFPSSRE